MSEPASALNGASHEGYVTVREAGLRGMVILRADLADAKVMSAVKKVAGVAVPGLRKIVLTADRGVGWMSPDELLLLMPYAEVPAAVAALSSALDGRHHLVADVSDARAVFRVEGARAREVLAKLSPTDLAPGRFGPGELRRTRLAQVPAAFWIEDDGFTLICFRSVAGYVFEILGRASRRGGEVGIWG